MLELQAQFFTQIKPDPGGLFTCSSVSSGKALIKYPAKFSRLDSDTVVPDHQGLGILVCCCKDLKLKRNIILPVFDAVVYDLVQDKGEPFELMLYLPQ